MFQHKPLLYITILLLQSCLPDKDQPKPADVLPPYTQQGANTIGCLVDGRVFVPQKNDLDGYTFEYYRNELTFYIDRDEERVYVGIWDGSITDTGEYELMSYLNTNPIKEKNVFCKVFNHKNILRGYITNNSHKGKLHINYWDKQKHIMAGTFYFDAVAADSSVVKITQGRFDMIYN